VACQRGDLGGQNAGVLMRGWWMKGMFALLARAGTSSGPYAGWEVFMVGPMVGLDRKVPSPGEQLPNG
jgi:hypothetical protein